MENLTTHPLFFKLIPSYINPDDVIYNQKDAFPNDTINSLNKTILFLTKQKENAKENQYFTETQKQKSINDYMFIVETLKFRLIQLENQLTN